jgi:hypothetical protein
MLFSEIIIGIDVSVPYRVCVCLYASKVLTLFIFFFIMSRDAKALQEKTAKKAAQDAAGGSKK